MTTLTKPLSREIILPGDTHPTIITMDPETKSFIFRSKGCHKSFSFPMLAARIGAVIGKRGNR